MKLKNITNKIQKLVRNNFFRGGNSVSYIEAKEILRQNVGAILLDVRSKQEYDEYHLDGAICVSLYDLEYSIKNIIKNKEQIIIAYCQSGARSKKAINILQKLGYTNLYNLDGGIDNI